MAFYLVKVRQVRELEGYFEADSQGLAEDTAKMETRLYGEIVDEMVITEQVEEAATVD